MASYIQERAYDGTHHVAQEAVCCYREDPQPLPSLFPICFNNTAVVGFCIGMKFAETGEVGSIKE